MAKTAPRSEPVFRNHQVRAERPDQAQRLLSVLRELDGEAGLFQEAALELPHVRVPLHHQDHGTSAGVRRLSHHAISLLGGIDLAAGRWVRSGPWIIVRPGERCN